MNFLKLSVLGTLFLSIALNAAEPEKPKTPETPDGCAVKSELPSAKQQDWLERALGVEGTPEAFSALAVEMMNADEKSDQNLADGNAQDQLISHILRSVFIWIGSGEMSKIRELLEHLHTPLVTSQAVQDRYKLPRNHRLALLLDNLSLTLSHFLTRPSLTKSLHLFAGKQGELRRMVLEKFSMAGNTYTVVALSKELNMSVQITSAICNKLESFDLLAIHDTSEKEGTDYKLTWAGAAIRHFLTELDRPDIYDSIPLMDTAITAALLKNPGEALSAHREVLRPWLAHAFFALADDVQDFSLLKATPLRSNKIELHISRSILLPIPLEIKEGSIWYKQIWAHLPLLHTVTVDESGRVVSHNFPKSADAEAIKEAREFILQTFQTSTRGRASHELHVDDSGRLIFRRKAFVD